MKDHSCQFRCLSIAAFLLLTIFYIMYVDLYLPNNDVDDSVKRVGNSHRNVKQDKTGIKGDNHFIENGFKKLRKNECGKASLKQVFLPKNTHQIKTVQNICIVDKPKLEMVEIENGIYATGKDIIVYDSLSSKDVTFKVTSGNTHNSSWPLKFTTKKIPKQFVIKPYPAYFIIPTHPGNFYHWFHDSTVGLYGAMKLTNRLNSCEPNQVIQLLPITGSPDAKNRTRFADIIKAFSVRDDQNVYHAFPSGTCFRYGVFGWRPSSHKEVAGFISGQLDKVYPPECQGEGITVTLIKRKRRKILNTEELRIALNEAGYITKVVSLEDMSFKEQWRAIRCTRILIGVQGAGIQWCIFLPNNSGVVELAHNHWGFYFTLLYGAYKGLKFAKLRSNKTVIDWQYISKVAFSGKNMTDAMKIKALSKHSVKKFPQLWGGAGFKWADSEYDPEALVKKVNDLCKQLQLVHCPQN